MAVDKMPCSNVIEVEDLDHTNARLMMACAVECALVRLSPYAQRKSILNHAHSACPASLEIFMESAKLEERNNYEQLQGLELARIVDKAEHIDTAILQRNRPSACASEERVWFEAAMREKHGEKGCGDEEAMQLLAEAVARCPRSVKLWLFAAKMQPTHHADKRRVLVAALQAIEDEAEQVCLTMGNGSEGRDLAALGQAGAPVEADSRGPTQGDEAAGEGAGAVPVLCGAMAAAAAVRGRDEQEPLGVLSDRGGNAAQDRQHREVTLNCYLKLLIWNVSLHIQPDRRLLITRESAQRRRSVCNDNGFRTSDTAPTVQG